MNIGMRNCCCSIPLPLIAAGGTHGQGQPRRRRAGAARPEHLVRGTARSPGAAGVRGMWLGGVGLVRSVPGAGAQLPLAGGGAGGLPNGLVLHALRPRRRWGLAPCEVRRRPGGLRHRGAGDG